MKKIRCIFDFKTLRLLSVCHTCWQYFSPHVDLIFFWCVYHVKFKIFMYSDRQFFPLLFLLSSCVEKLYQRIVSPIFFFFLHLNL